MSAERANTGKLKWSYLYFPAIEETIRVLMFGATKYAPNNWKKWFKRSELLESMQRHIILLFNEQEHDSESKLHHTWHIICNAMFYYFHYMNNSFIPEESMLQSSLKEWEEQP